MRHKFYTLDGLRGVAAISVMAYHRRDWFGGSEFFGHAFLAVDFFFLLSGFVLAHAYGERLKDRNDVSRFVGARIIRLHPMLIAGASLAMLVAFLDAWKAGSTLTSPLLYFSAHSVPFPVLWGTLPAAFPWNIAIWSLFWEIIANMIFAFLAPSLTDKMLGIIVAFSIITMIFVSLSANGFQVGFARDYNQFIWGFPRVCASFFLGVLICRKHNILPFRGRYQSIICAGVLILTFFAVPSGSPVSIIYDPLVAYGIYPILLIISARTEPSMPRVAAWFGAVSYPIYIIHEPMLKIVGGTLTIIGLADDYPGHIEAIIRFCIVVILAFLTLKLYDEPVRARLRNRYK